MDQHGQRVPLFATLAYLFIDVIPTEPPLQHHVQNTDDGFHVVHMGFNEFCLEHEFFLLVLELFQTSFLVHFDVVQRLDLLVLALDFDFLGSQSLEVHVHASVEVLLVLVIVGLGLV